MAEFCGSCKSLIVNGNCSNRACPLKIEANKKLQKKLEKIMDECMDELKSKRSKTS